MEHYKILRDLEGGNISPIYLLMGDESYFIDEIIDYMDKKLLDETEKSFNQTVVYGRDTSLNQIISLAKGYPMMGDRQVIFVKEAQDLKEWKKSSELDELIHYLEHPQSSTVLVFAHKNKSVSKKLKVWKSFQKSAVVFDSAKIRDYKVAEWIKGYTEIKGYKVTSESAQLLADYLGNDLGKLVNELNKLMIIVPKETVITRNHIQDNIGISKDYNVFELTKALGEKDIMKANQIITYFEANPKSNPIQMVLPMLYNYFSKMLAYKSLKNKTNLPAVLGVSPWQAKEIGKVSQNYKMDKLIRIVGYLRDTDRKSKGVENYSISDGFLMKELIFKILHY